MFVSPSYVVFVKSLSYSNLLTLWTEARKAFMSFTNSLSLLRLMSIELVMLTISSSAAPFCFYLQSFPASGSFPMSWLFSSGDQSIGASTSASVLPMNIQGWFPLGWTGWISFQSKRLSKVFSSTTIPKYQFFSTQPSLWSKSHINMWLIEKW